MPEKWKQTVWVIAALFFRLLVLVWSWIAWKYFLLFAMLHLVEVGHQSQNSSFSCVTTNFLSAFCPTSSRRTTTHNSHGGKYLKQLMRPVQFPLFSVFGNVMTFNTPSHFYLIVQLSSLQGLLSSPPTFMDVRSQDKAPWVNSFSSSLLSANIRHIKVNHGLFQRNSHFLTFDHIVIVKWRYSYYLTWTCLSLD